MARFPHSIKGGFVYCFDSCICIDFMRGRLPRAYDLLRRSDPRLFGIPSVVAAELFTGATKSNRPEDNRFLVEEFLLPFEIIPFDALCAREYASIRSRLEAEGKKIGPNDLLIAATARAHGAVLVTRNVREFKRVSGLALEDWSEVDLS